jgi:hypothetical protein
MNKHRTLDEEIAAHLAQSHKAGELQRAKDWGKPLNFGDGYEETPDEYRLPFKILKDAGFVPPEVELMKRLSEMRERLRTLAPGSAEATALKTEVADLELKVAIRIEAMR